MHLHQDVHVGANGLSHRPDVLHCRALHVFANVGPPWPWKWVELQGRKSHLDHLRGLLRQPLRRAGAAGPAVGVHADLVATGAAQEHVGRGA